MGSAYRLIQKRHKLKDDVKDRASRQIGDKDKPTQVLTDAPGAFNIFRGVQRRQDADFSKDTLNRKKDLVWYRTVAIARVDFGSSDNGLRMTFPATTEVVGEGLQLGDEIKIIDKGSALSGKKYVVTTQTLNNTNVSAGYARKVSTTVVRLPDDAAWSDETGIRVRIAIGAGVRSKTDRKNAEGKSLRDAGFVSETVTKAIVSA